MRKSAVMAGRDGTLAAVVRELPGVRYAAAAQGVRRFWHRVEEQPEPARFVRRLREQMSHVNV